MVLSLEVFSLSIWGSVTYSVSETELLDTISSRLSESAFRTQAEIGNFLLPVRLQTKLVAEELVTNNYDLEAIKRLFHRFIRSRPEAEEISLIDIQGQEQIRLSRMNSYGPGDLRNLAGMSTVVSALNNQPKATIVNFSDYLEPQIQIATPVIQNGRVKQAILCLVNLKWLWSVIHAQHVGKTGYVYVVDENLTLIGHEDPSLVLSQLAIPETSIPIDLFDFERSEKLKVYKNFIGQDVAGVSRYDPINKWWVVVEQPVAEGLAPLERIIVRFVIIFLATMMVSIIVVLIFSKVTMRPLEYFEHGITRVAKGERNVNIPVPVYSELASLARNFNAMAESLDRQFHELNESEQRVRQSEERYRQLNESLQQRVESATKQLRDANLELEKAYIHSQQASKAKSEFLAKMSHELRTPLNAIIGYSEMLSEEVETEEQQSDTQKVITAAKHLLDLINKLLDLSKIEAGKIELFIERFDVPRLVQEAVDTVQPLLTEKNNRFELHCPAEIHFMISDSTKLKQTLINLLGNACKFTENGCISVYVSLTKKHKIQFEIRDTGIGMSETQLSNLFQSFTQADASIHARYGGTGLGLVISRHFCNMLGGEISVKSELGKGTSFFVILPLSFDKDKSLGEHVEVYFAPRDESTSAA